MSMKQKLSAEFDVLIANSGSNEKRDAIVIYRASNDQNLLISSKDRTDRLKYIKQRADQQRMVYGSFAQAYQARHLASKIELKASSVGSNVLPVAQVEVTSETLLDLAEQPDVVAVLSNQRLHSIEPTAVDYRAASSTESKAGFTWGLMALGVPELWNTTKGEHITVAVLDTGVHGDHPCLSGRVQKFVLVDPLGRRIDASPSFDSGRHGTHVCGTIAGGKTKNGIAIGVAPQANLLAAGVLVGNPTLRTLIEVCHGLSRTGPTSSTCRSASPTTNPCSFRYSGPLSKTITSFPSLQLATTIMAIRAHQEMPPTHCPSGRRVARPKSLASAAEPVSISPVSALRA